MFRDLKRGIVFFLVTVSILINARAAEPSFPNAEVTFAKAKEASTVARAGLREYLSQNCLGAMNIKLSPMPNRHLLMCQLLSMLDRHDVLSSQIETFIEDKKVFVQSQLSEHEWRSGFFAVNPRLSTEEREEFVSIVVKKILLEALLRNSFDMVASTLKSGVGAARPDSIINAVFASHAIASSDESAMTTALIMANYSSSIQDDLNSLLSNNKMLIQKVASTVLNYNSVIWPEYEVFKPIIEADALIRRLKNSDRDSLYDLVINDKNAGYVKRYVTNLSNFVATPLQFTDESLKGLYAASLFSLDLHELLSKNSDQTSKTFEFKNPFMNEVQTDLLKRLNFITDFLRRTENELLQ